jgi:hypothetical protein
MAIENLVGLDVCEWKQGAETLYEGEIDGAPFTD